MQQKVLRISVITHYLQSTQTTKFAGKYVLLVIYSPALPILYFFSLCYIHPASPHSGLLGPIPYGILAFLALDSSTLTLFHRSHVSLFDQIILTGSQLAFTELSIDGYFLPFHWQWAGVLSFWTLVECFIEQSLVVNTSWKISNEVFIRKRLTLD